MIEHESHHSPVPTAEQRGALLDEFEARPSDEKVWRQAFEWVRAEGDEPSVEVADSTAADIPAEELIRFAERIRHTDPQDRYDRTVEQAPNGRIWFDVLRGFSSEQIERAEYAVLESLAGGYSFGNALDLATGTGKSLAKLEAVSEHVVGIDHNPLLLGEAVKLKADNTELVEGSVVLLPFPDNGFDVVSSTGISWSLDRDDATKFFTEIARVLAPGGVYVEGSYIDNDEGSKGAELAEVRRTSKAMLTDMMVDSISGKSEISDQLSWDERAELYGQLGLTLENYFVPDELTDDGTVSWVQVLTKETT